MSEFDKIIGYGSIKKELMKICDMCKNPEPYRGIGAKFPKGILLYGEPGLGKTLMAKCLIKETGAPFDYFCRREEKEDILKKIDALFNPVFIDGKQVVRPKIVFLDDLDKLALNADRHKNSLEYTKLQECIDKSPENIFVVATANDISRLPESLLRPGRFDRIIEVEKPSEKDSEKIIEYYLSSKNVSEEVNRDDLSKMIRYSSCAELDNIINEAAIMAAFDKRDKIGTKDLINAVLCKQYNTASELTMIENEEKRREVALHEAGHLVCCEVLQPGSVGMATIHMREDSENGFIFRCHTLDCRRYYVISSLAGKAAVELYIGSHVASGCADDLFRAGAELRAGIGHSATAGLGFADVSGGQSAKCSQQYLARTEEASHAMMEMYYMKAKDIILKNREFLEKVAEALMEKGTLLASDIAKIKSEVKITEVSI